MKTTTVRFALTALLGLAALAAPQTVSAQDMDRDMDHEMEMGMEMPGLAAARTLYESVRDFVMTAAENTPEAMYDYRPTDEVRSLGELYGHVGNAQYLFCGGATGESANAGMNLEEGTKAQIVAGLKAAFAFCDAAYAGMGHQELHGKVTFFGAEQTRIHVLVWNATHNWEHYGNIVTYLRMNGLVPPSSGGMQGGE